MTNNYNVSIDVVSNVSGELVKLKHVMREFDRSVPAIRLYSDVIFTAMDNCGHVAPTGKPYTVLVTYESVQENDHDRMVFSFDEGALFDTFIEELDELIEDWYSDAVSR